MLIVPKKKILLKNKKLNKLLKLSEPIFDSREFYSVYKCLINLQISQGHKVKIFEKLFAKKMGCKYGIALNSGSSANLVALNAIKNLYNFKPGSEIIVPASTFVTVVSPIIQLGLVPVFVDVNLDSLNVNILSVKKAINKKTVAIMPVHTLGLPCEIRELRKIANKNNLILLEDCCEAHGASINKKKVGSWGDLSTFSFFVAHNMTTGEGGMIITNNKKVEIECRSLREFGRVQIKNEKRYLNYKNLKNYDKRYVFNKIGYNLRMTDIAASIGIEQLKKLNKFNFTRIKNANYLKKKINLNLKSYFDYVKFPRSYINTYYTFALIIKNKYIDRMKLCKYLEKNNIETRPMMGGCLPDQPAFKNSKLKTIGNLKNSRIIRDRCFFIGIHPLVTYKKLNFFIKILSKFCKKIKI